MMFNFDAHSRKHNQIIVEFNPIIDDVIHVSTEQFARLSVALIPCY